MWGRRGAVPVWRRRRGRRGRSSPTARRAAAPASAILPTRSTPLGRRCRAGPKVPPRPETATSSRSGHSSSRSAAPARRRSRPSTRSVISAAPPRTGCANASAGSPASTWELPPLACDAERARGRSPSPPRPHSRPSGAGCWRWTRRKASSTCCSPSSSPRPPVAARPIWRDRRPAVSMANVPPSTSPRRVIAEGAGLVKPHKTRAASIERTRNRFGAVPSRAMIEASMCGAIVVVGLVLAVSFESDTPHELAYLGASRGWRSSMYATAVYAARDPMAAQCPLSSGWTSRCSSYC